MSDEMSEAYLWDRSGPPDPAVQRLERLLGGHKYAPPAAVELPVDERGPRLRLLPVLAAAAALAVAFFGLRSFALNARDSYRVEGVPGVERLRVGERLETGTGEATVYVAAIGDVEVGPGSQLRAERIAEGSHHLFLERGRIRASIFADPHVFQVGTPAGWSIDLGCEYDLEVDDDGNARLTVLTGRVAFRANQREVILPRGFWCDTVSGEPPNVPVRVDAAPELVEAVRAIERATAPDPQLIALVTDADATPVRDHSVTLWHLFVSAESKPVRAAVFGNLKRVYPLPSVFAEEQVWNREQGALAAWLEVVQRDWPGTWLKEPGF
jgi:hypothetical protein